MCGSIYAMSSTKPADENALAFLGWVLASGQQFLNPNGFSVLASRQRQSNLEALANTDTPSDPTNQPVSSRTWLIVLIGVVSIGIIVMLVTKLLKNGNTSLTERDISIAPGLDENSFSHTIKTQSNNKDCATAKTKWKERKWQKK